MLAGRSKFFSKLNALVAASLIIIGLGIVAAFAPERPAAAAIDFLPYPAFMVYPVRVGISSHAPVAKIATWSDGAVFIDQTPIFPLKPGLVYLIQNGRITEYATGRSIKLPTDQRARIAARDCRIWCNNRWWRGTLEIIFFGQRLTVINLLDLEDYLKGVVPSEMPSSWAIEALKAQAVAARSYAFAHIGPGSKWLRSEGYDIVPDVRDQAYKGMAAEAPSTELAVNATRGIILKDSGRVKPGFYRAWVGDEMENLNIRQKLVPEAELEKLTGVHRIVGVTVKQWDGNANAHSVQVMGATGSRDVYGYDLARKLNLATAGILDVKEQGTHWLFTYRGPGNGSRGLSQHGANMLAKRGWSFEQILRQYYQDTDGKLRLDYMDNYRALMNQAAMSGVGAANASSGTTSSTGSSTTSTGSGSRVTKSVSARRAPKKVVDPTTQKQQESQSDDSQ